MNCTMCGREITKRERFCGYCGENNQLYEEPSQSTMVEPTTTTYYSQPTQTQYTKIDKLGFWLGFLSFVFPIAGFVLYFTYKRDRPNAAKTALVVSLISAAIGFYNLLNA